MEMMAHEDFIHRTFSRNPLAMFAPQPVAVTFESQEKGEKIILLLRAHVVTLVPPIAVTVFLLLVPPLLGVISGFLGVDLFSDFSAGQVFLMAIFWYLVTFGYALYQFIFWYFNVYLVTNERIVDIDFKGILHKEVSYANLNQIQDVSPKILGFFGTFFHFGHVFAQTAGTNPEFEFHNVARPEVVAQEILEQVRLEEGEKPGEVA